MSLSSLIKFYRQCYIEENRSQIIRNFFSKNVENRFFFDDKEQLISQFYTSLPLEDNYGQTIDQKLKLYSQEKEFIYATIFILGKTASEEIIFSPLLIFSADILKDEDGFLFKIDKENPRINFAIFNEISQNPNEIDRFFEQLYEIISQNELDEGQILVLSKFLEDKMQIKRDYFFEFPILSGEKRIKKILKQIEEEEFYLIAASATAIIKKSVNVRGIINELQKISEEQNFSNPIKSVYGNVNIQYPKTGKKGYTPAILSKAQTKILENSEKFAHTIVIGPPGTGKTFTIAALATEKFTKNKSVLITAATDQAVDIIAQKIEQNIGIKNIIIRAGRKEYKKQLISHLENILSNVYTENKEIFDPFAFELKINKLQKEIIKLENILKKRSKQELKRAKIFKNKGIFYFWLKTLNNTQKRHWEILNSLYSKYDQLTHLIKQHIENLYLYNLKQALKYHFKDLKTLLKAIKSKRGSKKEEYWSKINFNLLLSIFPIWLVKLSDLYSVLPLRKELFDYLIIDEATQIDLASPIPAMQRAKHTIITGDPKQLRHFSFLSKAKQNIFAQKFNVQHIDEYFLNYSHNSLIDIFSESASHADQFIFLDEHFRSLPSIINFSNKKFYSQRLKIMTSRPDLPPDMGLEIIFTGGKRDSKGINRTEANHILEKIKQIIDEQKNLPSHLSDTIGVLSIFRPQAEFLEKLIFEQINLKSVEKHKISIKTPYGFQGDEKDIMLLSFVLDDDSHSTAFRYLNNANVFNVAITRARKLQIIYHSFNPSNLKPNTIVREYFSEYENMIKNEVKTEKIKNHFLEDVKRFFLSENFEVWSGVYIAGTLIDLIIKKNDKFLAIDLIGYEGKISGSLGIEKYKILNRAKLTTFIIPYSYWQTEKNIIYQQIQNLMK